VDDGHVPHLTHPDVYARVLGAFATGVDLAARHAHAPSP
jgi:hypothetical protein